jgi:hypothetical protein
MTDVATGGWCGGIDGLLHLPHQARATRGLLRPRRPRGRRSEAPASAAVVRRPARRHLSRAVQVPLRRRQHRDLPAGRCPRRHRAGRDPRTGGGKGAPTQPTPAPPGLPSAGSPLVEDIPATPGIDRSHGRRPPPDAVGPANYRELVIEDGWSIDAYRTWLQGELLALTAPPPT